MGLGLEAALLDGAALEGATLEDVVAAVGVLCAWHAATEVMTAAPTSAMATVRVDIRLL
jgi:hypothetical protein